MLSIGPKRITSWVRIKPSCLFAHDLIEIKSDCKSLLIKKPDLKINGDKVSDLKCFTFNGILVNASQDTVYNNTTSELVSSLLKGYTGTIMCYGERGSGKTFTMIGSNENVCDRGIIARSLENLFKDTASNNDNRSYEFKVSYLQIYNDNIYDLLSKDNCPLQISDTFDCGACVKNLKISSIGNYQEALDYLFEGESRKIVSNSYSNNCSSRSHCVFTIYHQSYSRVLSGGDNIKSRLNFVDLASSENIEKALPDDQSKEETFHINKSLLYLKQIVLALSKSCRNHIPYRQCKLTHILKDSFDCHYNFSVISHIIPECLHIQNSISTLRFCYSLMCLVINPVNNVENDDAQNKVSFLESEVNRLGRELYMQDIISKREPIKRDISSQQGLLEIRRKVQNYLFGITDCLEFKSMTEVDEIFKAFREVSKVMMTEVEKNVNEKYAKREELIMEENKPNNANLSNESDIENKSSGKERNGKGNDLKPSTSKKLSKNSVENLQSNIEDNLSVNKLTINKAAKTEEKIYNYYTVCIPKEEKFEEFKIGNGCGLNRILIQNKNVLIMKKNDFKEKADNINKLKDEIDKTSIILESLKQRRVQEGIITNEEGDIVIGQDEYDEIKKLNELKICYKENYNKWTDLKHEIEYCQHLVDKCRQTMIEEFEEFYKMNGCYMMKYEADVSDVPKEDIKESKRYSKTENKQRQESRFSKLNN